MQERVREDDVFGSPHQQCRNVLQLVESSGYPGESFEGLMGLLDGDVFDEVADAGTQRSGAIRSGVPAVDLTRQLWPRHAKGAMQEHRGCLTRGSKRRSGDRDQRRHLDGKWASDASVHQDNPSKLVKILLRPTH